MNEQKHIIWSSDVDYEVWRSSTPTSPSRNGWS